ncbi:hypothetical protein RE428_32130 [Marinobacter nanhaiticus D15-8W]|uniref:hypothetical protein n=1 Tax=Marinobacter nanhaiticus TaxID=1305740 RepID=UPI00039F6F13|nr:hypothetical protein [Marinobacter nanhaiticus]BES72195.1 hypothetical protein RE428_32130 [Marinobacter nanhaiticus D15-8W]
MKFHYTAMIFCGYASGIGAGHALANGHDGFSMFFGALGLVSAAWLIIFRKECAQ